jgi:group I intron endonuclease
LKSKKEIISGVYMIKNIVNGYIYIGSAIDIRQRWALHKYSLRRNTSMKILQEAWNQYGEQNFEFFIIQQTINDETIIGETEQYYIDMLEPYKKNIGYNKNKTVTRTIKRKNRIVYQYGLNGEFIKEWKSISEAGREVKIKASGIYKSCNNYGITAAAFFWRFEKTNNLSQEEILSNKLTPILQYSLDGIFINEWKSVTEAAMKLNISLKTLFHVCAGRSKTAGGFIWRLKEKQIYFTRINPESDYRKKPVLQLDLNNNLIKEWDSTMAIEKELGIGRKTVSRICDGNNKKQPKKFNWKWKIAA